MKVYDRGEQWKKNATCRGMGTELFFDKDSLAECKKICAVCPVKTECLEYGLFHGSHGIWGGVSAMARCKINVDKRFVCAAGHDCRWNERLVCYQCVNERVVDLDDDEFVGDFRDIRFWNISYGATKYDL